MNHLNTQLVKITQTENRNGIDTEYQVSGAGTVFAKGDYETVHAWIAKYRGTHHATEKGIRYYLIHWA